MKPGNNVIGPPKSLKLMFRTIGYRNFRLFFIGYGISMIGSWMQQVAMSWLVYRLTDSSLLLGVVGFAGLFPGFILAPLAGVCIDRWDRRKILFYTQVLAMLQAIVLAVLVYSGLILIWHIIWLSVILGLITAFDIPARQSFIVDLIEKRDDLSNAIALNSALFNGARFVGPSLAGIIVAAAGEGVCFVLNAISYGAVIVTLIYIRTGPAKTAGGDAGIMTGFTAGFKYAFGFLPIRLVLFLLGLISLMGMPYMVLMPVFAKDIFHGGAQTLGFLMASSGGGALLGALYLASRKSVLGMGKIIPIAAGSFGVGILLFSLSRSLTLSLVLLFFSGLGLMIQLAASNTIIQTVVEDQMRGRVMSFFAMAFMGTAPLGNLLAGAAADLIGATPTLIIGGASCIWGALLYARRLPLIREIVYPLYVKKGIMPAREGSPPDDI